MTPAEADHRIILSRQVLARYGDMTRAGRWPIADLHLMQNEIAKIQEIAEAHPDKATKLEKLVESWRALVEAVKGKMN